MTAKDPKLGDRDKLNRLKANPSPILDRFTGFMGASDINAMLFKSYFADLHRALVSADIRYHQYPNKIVRFDCCLIDQAANPRNFESILVLPGEITETHASFESGDIEQEAIEQEVREQKGIELDDDVWVEGNTERLFKAYIEIVYQVRCNLFHGDLVPDAENHRVIRLLYLTLFMTMEDIG